MLRESLLPFTYCLPLGGTLLTISEALYDEQKRMFGNSDGTFRDVEYEEVKNMPIMDSCIREALRLVSSPFMISPLTRADALTARPHPLYLPKSNLPHYRPPLPSRPIRNLILHNPNLALHASSPRSISNGPPNLARRRNMEPIPMDR